jgi:2-polyprenyl-3-methyl-5-hydroxy-6-metoxy-1,4-benzoquinol methylase
VPDIDPSIRDHYLGGSERDRLASGAGRLEFVRTQELLARVLPPAPAAVLDVGGAAGVHAAPLAARGYQVHLIDPVPLHVEQARAVPGLASVSLGDARALDWSDATVEAFSHYGLAARPCLPS